MTNLERRAILLDTVACNIDGIISQYPESRGQERSAATICEIVRRIREANAPLWAELKNLPDPNCGRPA